MAMAEQLTKDHQEHLSKIYAQHLADMQSLREKHQGETTDLTKLMQNGFVSKRCLLFAVSFPSKQFFVSKAASAVAKLRPNLVRNVNIKKYK